jgi:2-polyprenyl-3-methyl-5-hydroxy-6-metoxy-1,4-benzoquinol methylase
MTVSVYDQMGDFYYHFIKKAQQEPLGFYNLSIETMLKQLGNIQRKWICDLACGEGYLSRLLAQRGAHVIGVDLSSNLLDHARRQSQGLDIAYLLDDAQALTRLDPATFDIVISNLALMDIPDLKLVYLAVQRILKDEGIFLFSVLHPCFETPFRVPESIVELDENGNFVACRVMHYIEEGKWNSGGMGMRGTHGAYHRKLSTYINLLIASGFELKNMAEPTLPLDDSERAGAQWDSQIPTSLIAESVKKMTTE